MRESEFGISELPLVRSSSGITHCVFPRLSWREVSHGKQYIDREVTGIGVIIHVCFCCISFFFVDGLHTQKNYFCFYIYTSNTQ